MDCGNGSNRFCPERNRKGSGRPALPNRQVVNGILFVLRSGCQWKGLKKEWYGASSSLHQRFQDWNEAGVWKKVYRVMVKYYHTKRHIRWQWQAVDSKMVPAPLGGDQTGPDPTDRANGAPSATCGWINAERRCPFILHLPMLMMSRRSWTCSTIPSCADRKPNMSSSSVCRQSLSLRTLTDEVAPTKVHTAHPQTGVRQRPAASSFGSREHPARRWVVERTLSWQNNFRSLRVRWAKKSSNWLALIYFACTLILWRMCCPA